MPRVAAEGGEGLAFLDLRPAAGAMGFVVGVDAVVLAMTDATDLARPGVSKVAVLHGFEPCPAMAEWLADQCSTGHHDGVPETRVIGVQVVVDVVQSHPEAPPKRPGPSAFTKRFGDELSDLFEHGFASPAVHRQAGRTWSGLSLNASTYLWSH